MGGIFISYRREDGSGYAIPLYDRLVKSFGRERVFKDIEVIRPGEDFVAEIERNLISCDVLIAMIGKTWLSSKDDKGQQRLSDSEDFVRRELQAALDRNIRVIPVLVGGAAMPKIEDLPSSLVELARRQWMEINDKRFHGDMDALIESLADIVTPIQKSNTDRPSWMVPAGIIIVLVAITAVFAFFHPITLKPQVPESEPIPLHPDFSLALPFPIPVSPQGPPIPEGTESSVTFEWVEVKSADSYELYITEANGKTHRYLMKGSSEPGLLKLRCINGACQSGSVKLNGRVGKWWVQAVNFGEKRRSGWSKAAFFGTE